MIITQQDNRIIFHLKVIANASNTSLSGIAPLQNGMAFKMHVKAAREKGKANQAIVAFLSELLNIPKKNIAIKTGETNTIKTIAILNTPLADVQKVFKNIGFPVI